MNTRKYTEFQKQMRRNVCFLGIYDTKKMLAGRFFFRGLHPNRGTAAGPTKEHPLQLQLCEAGGWVRMPTDLSGLVHIWFLTPGSWPQSLFTTQKRESPCKTKTGKNACRCEPSVPTRIWTFQTKKTKKIDSQIRKRQMPSFDSFADELRKTSLRSIITQNEFR